MPQVKITRTTYLPGKEFTAGETYDVNDDEYAALKRAEVVDDKPAAEPDVTPRKKKGE